MISLNLIKKLATSASYQRGRRYHAEGRVRTVTETPTAITAEVSGTERYRVVLRLDGASLGWSCSCPAADDGSFCKHCVAVALVHLDGPVEDNSTSTDTAKQDDLASYVADLPPERLAELVLEAAEADRRFGDRLRMARATSTPGAVDLKVWKKTISTAFGSGRRMIRYGEMPEWAAGVHVVLDSLAGLCDVGEADAVITLCEFAHSRTTRAIQYVDDDGWLNDISFAIANLHQRACREGSPSPVKLAKRLVDLEFDTDLLGFDRAVITYADLLGDKGLAAYERALQPMIEAAARSDDKYNSALWGAQRAQVGLGIARKDPEAVIAVRAVADMHPSDYEDVVEAFVAAGRIDEAIEWGLRGLDGATPHASGRLRIVVSELLQRVGRGDEVFDLHWQAFAAQSTMHVFEQLAAAAGGDLDRAVSRATDHLTSRIASLEADGASARSVYDIEAHATTMAQILLSAGRVDDAWAVASAHGCSNSVWMSLARAREADHPMDSVQVYERQALADIATANRSGYTKAVRLMRRIERVCADAARPDAFDDFVTRVRIEHKAKRTLIAMLDAQDW